MLDYFLVLKNQANGTIWGDETRQHQPCTILVCRVSQFDAGHIGYVPHVPPKKDEFLGHLIRIQQEPLQLGLHLHALLVLIQFLRGSEIS